jgi:hypothetical protein
MITRLTRSPILVLLLIEGAFFVLMYKNGFRVTYSPELETSWEAISAIGQWTGVLVGFLIPIAAVYLQNKLDQNKEDIGESNAALLEEVEKFRDDYEDKLKRISNRFDDRGGIKINGGLFEKHKKENRSKEELKNEARRFVNISMVTKTKKVAEHLGTSPD